MRYLCLSLALVTCACASPTYQPYVGTSYEELLILQRAAATYSAPPLYRSPQPIPAILETDHGSYDVLIQPMVGPQ